VLYQASYIAIIFGLFNDAVSGSDYMALNSRITSEQRIGKDVEGNCHGISKVQSLHLPGRIGEIQGKPQRY
jgi:hypothetical protein